MTQGPFIFGQPPANEGPSPGAGTQMAAPSDATESSRRNRLLLGTGVGAALAAALGYVVLFSGLLGGDPGDLPRTPIVTRSPSPSAAERTPAPGARAKTPVPSRAPVVRLAKARDPFNPLVKPASATGAGATGLTSTAGDGTAVVPAPVAPRTPASTSGPSSTASGTPAPTATRSPTTFSLIDVADNNTSARVTVGTKSYAVALSDTFATYFTTIRLLNGKCGVFRYSGQQLSLCEGDIARLA